MSRSCCFASWIVSTALSLATVCEAQVVENRVPPPPPVERSTSFVPGRDVQISGLILRTKQVDDRTTGEKMLVAQLDVGDAERRLVDLGPTRIYKNAPLYVGDRIVVYGPEVRLGNAQV